MERKNKSRELEIFRNMGDSIPMKGGDGPNSYTKNSKQQEVGLNKAKSLLIRSIQEKLILLPNNEGSFFIADLGCSVGPNTFLCVQTIIDEVKRKHKTETETNQSNVLPEFHVFFNDHVANDFNTLFKNLPVNREYMASGVPGSFHGRLFPKSTMNFMHSSYALHWLTKVPIRCGELNKGRITCFGSEIEVVEAYTDQFNKDIQDFFDSRCVEMAIGGLTAILIPVRPDETLGSESVFMQGLECLGHALADMVQEGLIDEGVFKAFNLPIFFPTTSEVKEIVTENKQLHIEIMEKFDFPVTLTTSQDAHLWSMHIRAVLETGIVKHFGVGLNIDDLFKRYSMKLQDYSKLPSFMSNKFENLFLLVKRVKKSC